MAFEYKPLFLTGIGRGTSSAMLLKECEKRGNVKQLWIPPNSLGIGLLSYTRFASAQDAVTDMNGLEIGDSKLTVRFFANPKRGICRKSLIIDGIPSRPQALKFIKELGDHGSLSQLELYPYSSGFAVVDYDNVGIAKNLIRRYNGISLCGSRLRVVEYSRQLQVERQWSRSRKCVVVNGINSLTSVGDLVDKFGEIGELEMVQMPTEFPKKAFLEYKEEVDAELAVDKLDERELNGSRVCVSIPGRKRSSSCSSQGSSRNCLYVGGLAEKTSVSDLVRLFGRFGSIQDIRVPSQVSGVAFVEFEKEEDAVDAAKRLDGSRLKGRFLRVGYSKKRAGWTNRGHGYPRRCGSFGVCWCCRKSVVDL